MMNRLRNMASPASTWFGGIVGVPSAFRVSDSTTITLVKAVHSTSSAGAIDRTVSSRMMLTVWLGLPTPGSRLTETLPEPFDGRGDVAVDVVVGVGFGAVTSDGPAACATATTRVAAGAAWADGAPSRRTNSGASSSAARAARRRSATTGGPLAQQLHHRPE